MVAGGGQRAEQGICLTDALITMVKGATSSIECKLQERKSAVDYFLDALHFLAVDVNGCLGVQSKQGFAVSYIPTPSGNAFYRSQIQVQCISSGNISP